MQQGTLVHLDLLRTGWSLSLSLCPLVSAPSTIVSGIHSSEITAHSLSVDSGYRSLLDSPPTPLLVSSSAAEFTFTGTSTLLTVAISVSFTIETALVSSCL